MAGDRFASVNPARPAEVIAELPVSSRAEVDAAVARAADAQRAWAAVPVPRRAETITAIGDVLAARKAQLATLVSREAGKILVEAGGDVQEAIDMAGYIAGQGRNAWGETVPCEMPNKMGFTTRHPVGVVGMITPWNFPVAIPSWKIFPALLAGNGVVIKPSEHAPQCCVEFVRACTDAGVPEELVQVVHGFGEVGAAIASHPGIRAVSFTGSVPTGRKVAAAAMETGPRLVSLELGGKNAMVVLPDADLELVVEGALFGAFGTAGQRCTSTSRLVVHRDVADELVDAIAARAAKLVIGDPVASGTDVGPVIDHRSAERIAGMVETGLGEGNTLVAGGNIVSVEGCDGGSFFEPTIVRGATRDSYLTRNEVFGPVLTVVEIDSFEDAIATVNDCEYGLSAAVYTRDVNLAMTAVHAIDTGIVYVNAPTIGAEIHLPFGGTKHTGNGYREAGRRGLEQFSETKSVYIDFSGRLQKAQIDNRDSIEATDV
ncbi:MAG TPA: aldehyde dehydrogenase family protein [Acidimicrobiia bacterium]|nr:aldehyde dehydrogenase family protein [Acidimicrobiia bacterium]